MNVGAKTDQGKIREQNEDTYGYRDNLFIVADGMGGHEAGEIASAIAVETVLAFDLGSNPVLGLAEAVRKANHSILNEMAENEGLSGMGTTIAILVVEQHHAYVTHVGDSRIYQLTQERLIQLTDDHSFVAELVKNGSITEEEAKNHPKRNILTRALGTKGELEFEVNVFPINQGDRFLLCSDGLTGMLEENVIKEYLSMKISPQLIADRLVQKANDNGGIDNITVIVIEV